MKDMLFVGFILTNIRNGWVLLLNVIGSFSWHTYLFLQLHMYKMCRAFVIWCRWESIFAKIWDQISQHATLATFGFQDNKPLLWCSNKFTMVACCVTTIISCIFVVIENKILNIKYQLYSENTFFWQSDQKSIY